MLHSKIIPHIIEQHAEEAAFLWMLRDNAITDPSYDLDDLNELEDRIEAHIDGLRVAGKAGWKLALDNLESFKESGEMFVVATLAFESQNPKKIKAIYPIAEAEEDTEDGLLSALSWVKPKQLAEKIIPMLQSEKTYWRRIGITACAIHRDTDKFYNEAIKSSDTSLASRALKAVGEKGLADYHQKLKQYFNAEQDDSRFWAAWSAILIGDRTQAIEVLQAFLLSETQSTDKQLIDNQEEDQEEYKKTVKAAQLIFRVLALETSSALLGTLVKQNKIRLALIGAAATGDSHYIPWFIQKMEIPEHARIAGEAFSLITGIDLAYDDLEGEAPKGFEAGPTESAEDDDVAMDADENLPWPDLELIQQWWQQHHTEYPKGQRHLMGKQINEAHCYSVLKTAKQRQRQAAALELALLAPSNQLFETRAKAKWQATELGISL